MSVTRPGQINIEVLFWNRSSRPGVWIGSVGQVETIDFDCGYAFGLGPGLVERANAAADRSRENHAQSPWSSSKH